MKTYESKSNIVSKPYVRRSQHLVITPSGCPDIFPGKPNPCPPNPCPPIILKTEIFQYTTISDGTNNQYTSNDAVLQFSTSGILDPNGISIINLFINGILQSPNLYVVHQDILILSEAPTQGVPIILQFIKITTS
ncbi:hypothetical protein BVG16_16175 [Paenibacillus selenitireducens]|uniref:DUF4183 domain-containing protein n=1 Tax=Paenibacillus selenitireducens TaxID=1324314 RepID=A0A1T2XAI2_9BACL|nr:DUF4183 domain-containing protein [Paenibacillus selenitireducens]OPA76706.1 hypothetical protein BVG16_16175 [Paenibacillus selenitireducens]